MWQPIETAPMEGRRMFVVKAFGVIFNDGKLPYTSDPYCVWRGNGGVFERWPHRFSPTHWMPLPDLPGAQPAPSVPEGWKLVPTAESRHPGIYKMLSALHAVDNTPGASEWESYAALLAAAPEAKP